MNNSNVFDLLIVNNNGCSWMIIGEIIRGIICKIIGEIIRGIICKIIGEIFNNIIIVRLFKSLTLYIMK